MRKVFYILIILVLFFGCTAKNIDNEITFLNNCREIWQIDTANNVFTIALENKILVQQPICTNCEITTFTDSLNQKTLIAYGNEIFSIDCLTDTLYNFNIRQHSTPKLKPSLSIIKDKYIYSDKGQFYLLDSNLTPIYSSWNYLKLLSDSNRLGLSGIDIVYKKQKNKIVITYKLLTDIKPVVKNTMQDTISVD